MAAITGAAIAAGTAIYSARQQSRAGDRAADAAQQGSAAEIAERQRQFDLSRQDQQPFMQAGVGALNRQEAALNGDFSGFQNSPDYAYSMQQMQQGLERGAAARGSLRSGGTSVDLASHLNGLANQNFSNYWNRLAGQAGQGQTSATNLGSLGAMMGNQNANSIGNASAARQSSYLNSGAANAGAAGALGGIFNNWYQQNSANNNGGSGWYLGQRPGAG
jgi:hypothetical protein